MNWKLIFALSLFGMAIGLADTFGHIEKIVPVLWLIIFIIYGVIIVRNASGNYFLHAFLVSVINGVWIGIIHASFYDTYMTNSLNMADMERKVPMIGSARMTMVIFGPIIGALFGLISGLITWIISKLMKKKTVAS